MNGIEFMDLCDRVVAAIDGSEDRENYLRRHISCNYWLGKWKGYKRSIETIKEMSYELMMYESNKKYRDFLEFLDKQKSHYEVLLEDAKEEYEDDIIAVAELREKLGRI